MANMFIPSKIRVGFQKREDTFTGKLAYVIYYDEKDKIRKETSWKSWCDGKIEALELDNLPRNNYVFNKGVKRDGHWGTGRSVIRVHDPRNFEFEISVDNLIGLLMHSDVSKRDIVEECVFAWLGAELVLLPVNSEEYQKSMEYTDKQSLKISAKELVAGHTYSFKKQEGLVTYVGYFPWFEWEYANGSKYGYRCGYARIQTSKGKKHIFHNGTNFVIPSASTLASVVSSEVDAEKYAELVDEFHKSNHAYQYTELLYGDKPLKMSDDYSKRATGYRASKVTGRFITVTVSDYYNKDRGMDNVSFSYYDVVTHDDQIAVNSVEERRNTYGYNNWNNNHHLYYSDEQKELSLYLSSLNPDYPKNANSTVLMDALMHLGYVGNMYFTTTNSTKVQYTQ